jgi:hypothetical protein
MYVVPPEHCDDPDIRTIVKEIFPHLLKAHERCGFPGSYTREKLTRFRERGEQRLQHMPGADGCREILFAAYRSCVQNLEDVESRREKISELKGRIVEAYHENGGIALPDFEKKMS